MSKSTYGNYDNVEESEYFYDIYDLRFYFSSLYYREKFIGKYMEYIHNERCFLRNKYKIDILPVEYFLICLYKSIEKKGFKVIYNNYNRIEENKLLEFRF